MKFNSRRHCAVYHFWIRVTQVPFTAARWLSPSRASATLSASMRRVVASRRVATRRVTSCHTAARLHGMRTDGILDAMRGSSIFVRHWNPRRILSSASPNVLRLSDPSARSRGTRENLRGASITGDYPEIRHTREFFSVLPSIVYDVLPSLLCILLTPLS